MTAIPKKDLHVRLRNERRTLAESMGYRWYGGYVSPEQHTKLTNKEKELGLK